MADEHKNKKIAGPTKLYKNKLEKLAAALAEAKAKAKKGKGAAGGVAYAQRKYDHEKARLTNNPKTGRKATPRLTKPGMAARNAKDDAKKKAPAKKSKPKYDKELY
ncbi:MAG: hypothetical protein K0U41_03730 [Gammaproteobacteria bacterium]|nr:hypothetical protein [Gammaproteobacteria bacterium]